MPYEELNLDLLAQHPAPFPDESLYGYILRLAEANGYSTPFAIFRLADLAKHPNRAGSIRVEQLARITNRDTAELDRFSYAPRNCLRPTARFLMLRLLGHDVRRQDLRTLHPSFCPDCVQEKGYVESHWDLAYMVACPVHHRPALSQCPGCKNPLSWFRRGLSVCRCGAILVDTPVAVVPQAELALLDLLRRKVLRLDVVEHATLGTAASDLYSLDLRSILVLMRVLSKHYSSHITFDQSDDPSAVVRDAAQVLSDWPQNFYRLLNAIGESGALKARRASVRQQFSRIYRDLFFNWELHPEAAADFVRRAFLDFAMNHWGRGILTYSVIKGHSTGLPKRFLNKTELARYLGVTPTTATRLVKHYGVPFKVMKCGKMNQYVFDLDELDKLFARPKVRLPAPKDKTICSLREAAELLGLPTRVLHNLKKSGELQRRYLAPRYGFHSDDIQSFKEMLLALAPDCVIKRPASGDHSPTTNAEFVTLSKLLPAHGVPGGGATIIKALLRSDLPVIGNRDGTIPGLMIPRQAYETFAQDYRARRAGDKRTPAEAADDLACDSETVVGLVKQGMLEGEQHSRGLRITEKSIDAFKERYISVASAAREIRSSSRGVLAYCAANGIPVLYVQTARKWKVQAFLRVEDQHRLRGFRARKARRRNERLVWLPIAVLKSLENSGHFEVKHPRRKRFHHLDILAFTNKLLSLAPPGNSASLRASITLEKAIRERYGSVEGRANLIRALLSKELPVVGNTNGTIGGLLLPRAKFREFFRKEVDSVAPGTGTTSLAGHNLGCDRRFIPGLVELGLLDGKRVGTAFRISEESIVTFKKSYLPVADVAKQLGTSSARLIRHCQQHEIQLLTVRSKMGSHPSTSFIHTEDQKLVLCSFPTRAQSARTVSDDSALPKHDLELANDFPRDEKVPAPALN